jgi:dynein heavy chain
MVEVKKNYRKTDFREDLKKVFDLTGAKRKNTVFYFSDTQVVEEGFLEDLNNMLSSGEVPNLYAADEFQAIKEEIRADARKADIADTNEELYAYFIERVREHMHIVIGMSPVGDAFRNRIRMFPALVNCTTIDWFSEWPAEALQEVGSKFLEEIDLGGPEIKKAVSQVFVTAHTSVLQMSKLMLEKLKRVNYVTPTNYLEFVTVYESLLSEKRKYIGDLANKLRNGLDKLEDTAKQVASMKVQLEDKKKVVAKAQKDCEDLLVVIVQEKRIVDEQEKEVRADEIKISKEKDEALAMAAEAQAELDKAIPALEAAQKALESLSKSDVSEVRAYAKPPPDVQTTLSAVMVVLKKQPSWDEAKRVMGDANFLSMLMNYDASNLSDALLSKINKFTANPDFVPELVGKVSRAAAGMCLWVRAIENFGRVSKVVSPKRAKVQQAMDELARKEKQLSDSRARLAEIMAKVQSLKDQYDKSIKEKETLRKEAEELELKLDRAEKLVNGLSGERARWEISIRDYETDLTNLVGDVLIAAAFLSYAGPFTSEFREKLVRQTWMPIVRQLGIPCSVGFSFSKFLARPTDVREWNIQGLPTDDFSTENGVLVTRGSRWPLMIDPQGQANKWVKNMGRSSRLRITDPKSGDFLRVLENSIPYGIPVLLQDVEEELDPSLEPLLARAILKQGNRMVIRLGDKDVEFNPDFRLFMTTKLANPRYAPEISTKAAIINFAVKEQGLEDQLLGIVVRKERPDLEEQKDELVVSMAAAKRKMVELEDEILRLLSEATGSLLDNEELILTLQTSKTTSEELKQQLLVAEQTEIKIDAAREQYRPCAARASILFFVLNDLASVDPMYQFALDAYIELFHQSIDRSMKSEDVPTRIKALNEYHTYSVYRSTCRGLFEKDKLLFSFQMCVRIMQHARKIHMDEYAFFLRGGQVLDKDVQPPNPCPDWLSERGWDNIYEVDRQLTWAFRGVVQSLEQLPQEWHEWFLASEPENTPLPGEWEGRLAELQRMVLVRCLRPDRVVFMATSFVTNNMGHKFVEPPVADLQQIAQETSSPAQPLIFVLSPGVDPTVQLQDLAKKLNVELYTLALGQGQDGPASRLLERGVVEGHWIFLANCHLMISWMPKLEKIIEDLPNKKPHARFRLWLSSSPHPKFPIAILQSGVKMTTEPPRGLKNNLLRLYSLISDEDFERCKRPDRYKKLLFALSFFHSVLVERRKFGTLGLNIPYDFNDSDFSVSENILSLYLDEYKEIPWAQLRYLVAEASYGGRVTDDFDRRLLLVYINQYFCDDAVNVDRYRLSSLSTYAIPKDGSLQSYRDTLQQLPVIDKPEAFGQHANADIASQIEEANNMLTTLLTLQPPATDKDKSGKSNKGSEDKDKDQAKEEKKEEKDTAKPLREDVVFDLATDLQSRIPDNLDYSMAVEAKADDPSALNIVLFQEILRYNSMLDKVRSSLADLKKGIKGLVVMTAELDEIFNYIYDGRVPPAWLKTYPSLKPLAGWTRDLLLRIQQLKDWAEGSQPKVFWLAGFTFPTGFLTAVLQNAARKLGVSIDTLVWDYSVVQVAEKDITQGPKDGVYVSGVFLEGAGWDHEKMCLAEPKPMQLLVDMPVLHFRPVEAKKKAVKGIYQCPLYMYPVRTGTRERPSYIISVDLKSGDVDPDHWVKRGAALLLATA